MYIIFVGPPGRVKKSTTIGMGEALLREIPGVHIGPSVITWQRLVEKMGEITEEITLPNGDYQAMSALTFCSSELGNFLDPRNREMVDALINFWDVKQGAMEKETKTSGNDHIMNPWINLMACTTPDWLISNMPQQMIGGGFTSRCVFLYSDKSRAPVAYPARLKKRDDFFRLQQNLIEDLKTISNLCGEFTLSEDAYEWGTEWYERPWSEGFGITDKAFEGYMGRKQSHIHKLAMCLSAASRDDLLITKPILEYSRESRDGA